MTIILRVVLVLILLLPLALPALAEGREISVYTSVPKWGQMPDLFEIKGQAIPEDAAAADFTITGQAAGWENASTHPFSCGVVSVAASADGWTLVPERFPEKYFYVRALEVTCAKYPELSFTFEDIAHTYTAVADEFTLVEEHESRLSARVFTPGAEGPLPVVIVFHGYGDPENLLSYRTATAWAEPENQAIRPCTVVAPVIINTFYTSEIARAKIFAGLMRYIDSLIESGQADPKRIYVMGNSFGGAAALELAEQYPDKIAAVLSLCPATMYFPVAFAKLGELTDMPVTVAQAENDETIPSRAGKGVAEALTAAGNPNVTLRIYSDEEMTASGAVFGQEQTYSFHHVELAVMEDPAYAEWLFSQAKE